MEPQLAARDGENDLCIICFEPLLDNLFRGGPISSGCGHWFHGPCLSYNLRRVGDRCPVCQSSLEIPRTDRDDEIILTYYPQRLEEERSFMQKLKTAAMPYVILLLVALLFISFYNYVDLSMRTKDLVTQFNELNRNAKKSIEEFQRARRDL